jgi:hypothetical protein
MYLVVKLLLKIPDTIPEMRQKVFDHLVQIPNIQHEWAPSTEGGAQSIADYMAGVLYNGYGDQHVLVALCRLYGFNYSIVRSDGTVSQSFLQSQDTEPLTKRIYAGFLPIMQHYVPLFPMV